MAGALQIVNTFKQNLTGSGTYDNFAPGAGDVTSNSDGSLNVPSAPGAALIHLEEIWAVDDSDALEISLTGPDFADRVIGFQAFAPFNLDGNSAAKASLVSPGKLSQVVRSGNQFFVRGADQGSGNGNIVFILRYSNYPGINAVLASAATVKAVAGNLVGVQVDLDASSGSGQGDWSEDVALTSGAGNQLDGAKFYAIVGFTADAPCAAVAVRSFETGQMRIGAPIVGEAGHDPYSLLDIADRYGDAMIPVIPGFNQSNVNLAVADPATTNVSVNVQLVEVPRALYEAAVSGGL